MPHRLYHIALAAWNGEPGQVAGAITGYQLVLVHVVREPPPFPAIGHDFHIEHHFQRVAVEHVHAAVLPGEHVHPWDCLVVWRRQHHNPLTEYSIIKDFRLFDDSAGLWIDHSNIAFPVQSTALIQDCRSLGLGGGWGSVQL